MLALASGQFAFSFAEDGAEDNDYLYIEGTLDYDAAYEVLDIVNAERSKRGIGQLSMDESLMDSAMTRAAECVLYFEHVRPSGERCFSINDKMSGENLAKGSKTAKRTMQLWMDSPGHRENVLRSEFHSIGIGCFIYNGRYYWAQSFGRGGSEGAQVRKTEEGSVGVDLPNDNILGLGFTLLHDAEEGDTRMEVGDTSDLQLIAGDIRFDPAKIKWTVSNPEVASVEEFGVLEVIGLGETTITASSGSSERASFKLTGEINIENGAVFEAFGKAPEIGDRIYAGERVRPTFVVLHKGRLLREGIDYRVSYADNGKPGAAAAIIRGINGYTGTVIKTFNISE